MDRSGQAQPRRTALVPGLVSAYYLKAVPGVAEVASLGGFGQQYQVNVDPNRLRSYGIPISRVVDAVRGGNSETAAGCSSSAARSTWCAAAATRNRPQDIEDIVLSANENGTPIRIKDVGEVVLGPDMRRGVADLDGTGEVVSGIVVMRAGRERARRDRSRQRRA